MKRWHLGFSLIELMIVLSIIAILAAVIFVNFNDSAAISRDAQRKADLRLLQNAIELYKLDNGRYPEACNGPTDSGNVNGTGLVLSGHAGTLVCPSGTEYIVGLAPKYIQTLPKDPKLSSINPNSGYVYAVNTSRTVYKIMALDTVEKDFIITDDLVPLEVGHEFFRCGSSFPLGIASLAFDTTPSDPGLCQRSRTRATGGWDQDRVTFNACTNLNIYTNDYALSGGYSTDNGCVTGNNPEKCYEFDTEIVRCQ